MAETTERAAIVLHAFGTYARGEIVRGEEALAAIRRDGRTGHVVIADIRTSVPEGANRGKA